MVNKKGKPSKGGLQVICGELEWHDIDELQDFQGNLKELYKDNAEKLWGQILKNGFADPFIIWKDDGKLNIISGHQRKRVLSVKRSEGWQVPKMPCIPVKCPDAKAAKELVLACVSQYGKVTDEGLYEFIVKNELNPELLKMDFDIPDLNMDYFMEGYFGKEDPLGDNEAPKGNEENKGGKNITCPNCGHVFDPMVENCRD